VAVFAKELSVPTEHNLLVAGSVLKEEPFAQPQTASVVTGLSGHLNAGSTAFSVLHVHVKPSLLVVHRFRHSGGRFDPTRQAPVCRFQLGALTSLSSASI